MTNSWFIRGIMSRWPEISDDGQRVLVPTHCLYPSNGIVQVVVEGGADAFRVHDDGRAFGEFRCSGRVPDVEPNAVRHIVSRQGLMVTAEGIIQSPLIGTFDLAGTISLVANASKEAAHHLIDRYRSAPHARSLEEALEAILDRRFHHEWTKKISVVGKSNKQQKFDYSVRLPSQKRLLIKVVKPEPSSINAAVVAHLDVKAANLPDTQQRSVYDDDYQWNSADLSLLTVGAPAVALSAANEALSRIAA